MSSLPVATSQIEPSSGVVKGLGDPAGAEIGFAECDDPRCLIEEQLPSPSEFDGGLQKGQPLLRTTGAGVRKREKWCDIQASRRDTDGRGEVVAGLEGRDRGLEL